MMNHALKNMEELCDNVRVVEASNHETSKSNRHVAKSHSLILYFDNHVVLVTCGEHDLHDYFCFLLFISLSECIAESCVNCGVCLSTDMCAYCIQLDKCRYCHRRLPMACFTTCNRTTCLGCAKRSMKPHGRRSVGDVITEIDVLTTPQDISFDIQLDMPVKFSNSLKNTVSNSGIALFILL